MSLFGGECGESEGLSLLGEGGVVGSLLPLSLGLEFSLALGGGSLSGGDLGGRSGSLFGSTLFPLLGPFLGLPLLLFGFLGGLLGKLSDKFLLLDLVLEGSLSPLGS